MKAESIIEKLGKYNLEGFSHTDEGLISHLMGNYKILKKWSCSEDLCIAGLCHSTYGTESYRRSPVSLSERKQIQEVIGSEAEKLTYYFGTHVKNSLWANLEREDHFSFIDRLDNKEINISSNELSYLITLTLANWLEQRPRAPKERLYIRQNEFLNSQKYLPKEACEDFKKAYGIN